MTDPVQTQPAQNQPEYAAHPPVAPKPKKTGIIVLAVLVVLLLGATGTAGALYVQEKNRAADLSKQLEEKDKRLTAQIMLAEQNLEQAKKADKNAADAQKCRDAAKALTAAALANDEAKGEAAMKDMMLSC